MCGFLQYCPTIAQKLGFTFGSTQSPQKGRDSNAFLGNGQSGRHGYGLVGAGQDHEKARPHTFGEELTRVAIETRQGEVIR